MDNNIMINNEKALYLINKDMYEAQRILKMNAKQYPCLLTFNNIGYFYFREGIQFKNGKTRNATKLGGEYLLKAQSYSISEINQRAISNMYYYKKDFQTAESYYNQAYKINNNYINLNNICSCLYMQDKYKEAAENYEKVLMLCNDTVDMADIYSSYAFTLLKIDKKKTRNFLNKVLKSDIDHILVDVFVLAYFCDDFLLANKLLKPMQKNWSCNCNVMAMAFDCLLRLNQADEAKEYLLSETEILKDQSYDNKKEIVCLEKAFSSEEYRKHLISNYRFMPLLIETCCYYGCEIHNNNNE